MITDIESKSKYFGLRILQEKLKKNRIINKLKIGSFGRRFLENLHIAIFRYCHEGLRWELNFSIGYFCIEISRSCVFWVKSSYRHIPILRYWEITANIKIGSTNITLYLSKKP
jgi:hypothetical protein